MFKTKDYGIFKKRDDNRCAGVNESHVQSLMRSIEKENLLEKNPIIVNGKMEVISGQHRLEACKRLMIEVPYIIDDDAKAEHMLLYGMQRRWTLVDILNFYVRNRYPEYIKLHEYLKETGLSMDLVLSFSIKRKKECWDMFRLGSYVFKSDFSSQSINNSKEIYEILKNSCSRSSFLSTYKFWSALLKITSNKDYSHQQFLKNCNKYVYKITPQAQISDYSRMLLEIYNARLIKKIYLD